VFVTRANDAQTRTVLAAQVPLLMETAKYAAYGPCARSDLAQVPFQSVSPDPSLVSPQRGRAY
jgi:hypothetical protein